MAVGVAQIEILRFGAGAEKQPLVGSIHSCPSTGGRMPDQTRHDGRRYFLLYFWL
jgi:hypothetical protein